MTEKLAKVLADVLALHKEQITTELTKEDVGSWDSLKQMDLVMSIEREFNVALEVPDIMRMDSVANIIAVLAERGAYLGH